MILICWGSAGTALLRTKALLVFRAEVLFVRIVRSGFRWLGKVESIQLVRYIPVLWQAIQDVVVLLQIHIVWIVLDQEFHPHRNHLTSNLEVLVFAGNFLLLTNAHVDWEIFETVRNASH